jgi:hypothetical protein
MIGRFLSHPQVERGAEVAVERRELNAVGHGGVRTLLICHVSDVQIGRSYDEPAGGGNAFERPIGKLIHGWQAMEMLNDPQQADVK